MTSIQLRESEGWPRQYGTRMEALAERLLLDLLRDDSLPGNTVWHT